MLALAFKDELLLAVGLSQERKKLLLEKPAEDSDGKKEMLPRRDPTTFIDREASSRHHAVKMGMMKETLAPGM